MGRAYKSTYWIGPKEELIVAYFTQFIPALNMNEHGKLLTQVTNP
tara:strand:- start:970 stop:1104 length:135 start_codon:yes stop_codon:yes gene_type:complete